MALDFALIDRSTQYAIDSLESSKTICPGLLYVLDLLDSELLAKLQTYIFDENIVWGIQEHHDGDGYHYDRKKINWISDSVIEETHMVLEGLTDYINQCFSRQNKFLGLSIWKDEHSYQVPLHIDNPVIDVSVQIYLNDNNMDLGTRFQLDTVFKIPYKTNHGYLMDNRQHIQHFYDGKSPEDYHRYSLYAIWADANK
jgi:hypothetical protein